MLRYASAATGEQLVVPNVMPKTGSRRERACRSCIARTSPPKPRTRQSSRCSDHWTHKRPGVEMLLVCCLLPTHACRSYTAHKLLPTPRMPLCSNLGRLRRSSLKGQALLALAQAEVPARVRMEVPEQAKAEASVQAAAA